ncbi:hypothetical protein A7P95_02640 [Eikenella longinqua]|uniref:Uncharacterized protein n=1 Tax=Eikenella longinqua TaxID=1795827 RepID=A0A1A9S0N1_9NEIS|nr:hypothetical protein A7P95_02640 [Eikenella longinqua]
MAGRAAGLLVVGAVALLHGLKILFRNQRFVGLPDDPFFWWIVFVAATLVVDGLPDINAVFQHM